MLEKKHITQKRLIMTLDELQRPTAQLEKHYDTITMNCSLHKSDFHRTAARRKPEIFSLQFYHNKAGKRSKMKKKALIWPFFSQHATLFCVKGNHWTAPCHSFLWWEQHHYVGMFFPQQRYGNRSELMKS